METREREAICYRFALVGRWWGGVAVTQNEQIIIEGRFSGDAVFFISPGTQINKLATLTTKWTPLVFWRKFRFLTAIGTSN
jgi:hypothetical protein